ncbi:hypothetical protein OROGR_011759 [Orobanche gracilis]
MTSTNPSTGSGMIGSSSSSMAPIHNSARLMPIAEKPPVFSGTDSDAGLKRCCSTSPQWGLRASCVKKNLLFLLKTKLTFKCVSTMILGFIPSTSLLSKPRLSIFSESKGAHNPQRSSAQIVERDENKLVSWPSQRRRDENYGKRCNSCNGSFGMEKGSCSWPFNGCAMIACKLATTAPERVLSLALLNVTGGGYECIPKFDRQTLSIAMRFLKAKTPEQRAAVDLDTHYSKEYLEELVGQKTRRSILYQEYVKGISATGMQSSCGFDGQVNACWTHKMSRTETESIRVAGFPISVIHGRHDVIAQMCHAKRLAEELYPCARMVELNGGHLVSHERTEDVNEALIELINASENRINIYDWTNLSSKSSGTKGTRISLWRAVSSTFIVESVEKLRFFLLYVFGLFVFAFEHLRRGVRRLNPVRIGPALT